MSDWKVVLDGVVLSGSCSDDGSAGTLSEPPDGLGLPPMRTEDVTYPQRDGVRHFNDWYEPRIITLQGVTVCADEACVPCLTTRQKLKSIVQAWSRRCEDVEMVIFTDCGPDDEDEDGFGEGGFGYGPFGDPTAEERALVGPFGVIGRPRVASYRWIANGSGCAEMLLRFDAVDHRMYVLDAAGTPGSGGSCITLTPDEQSACRNYPRCYDMCYDQDTGGGGEGPVSFDVYGDACVFPLIYLNGPLTNPIIENLDTGETIGYNGTITDGSVVIVNTEQGTATEGGQSRTHLLTGNSRFRLDPGNHELRLLASTGGAGTVDVCWRPAVVSA